MHPPVKSPANDLLNALITRLKVKNDAALCRVLGVTAAAISKIRRGKQPLTGNFALRAMVAANLTVEELTAIVGPIRLNGKMFSEKGDA